MKRKKKNLSGSGVWIDCGIKLVSWYQYSANLKSYIVITWVGANRISLKWSGPVNQATFGVYVITYESKQNYKLK